MLITFTLIIAGNAAFSAVPSLTIMSSQKRCGNKKTVLISFGGGGSSAQHTSAAAFPVDYVSSVPHVPLQPPSSSFLSTAETKRKSSSHRSGAVPPAPPRLVDNISWPSLDKTETSARKPSQQQQADREDDNDNDNKPQQQTQRQQRGGGEGGGAGGLAGGNKRSVSRDASVSAGDNNGDLEGRMQAWGVRCSLEDWMRMRNLPALPAGMDKVSESVQQHILRNWPLIVR